MNPHSPEGRLQRAAANLRTAATWREHCAADERIAMPLKVRRAVATIRLWTRQLSAPELDPPVRGNEVALIPARPRRRDEWKRGQRV